MTRARSDAVREVVVGGVMPVIGFFLYCDLLALADWGQGIERFTAIVFGAGLAFLLPRLPLTHPRAVFITLGVLAIAFFGIRTYEAERRIAAGGGPGVDVGTTTIAASDLVRRGENPYSTFIDPNGASTNPEGTGFTYAAGFKYGPVMIWTYMPFVTFLGPSGYFVLNWIALMATAVAASLLLSKALGNLAGLGAFLLTLVPGIVGRELFEVGFNDIVPVAFALMAVALRERRYPIAAGITLGLSIATKFIPGVIIALPLLMMSEKDRVPFGVTVGATAFLGHLPWLVTSTPELVAGLVTFNLNRTVDDTSILYWVPEALRLTFTALVLLGALVVSTRYARGARQRGLPTFCGLLAATLAVSFAASPAVHGNYLLWYFPFIGVAIAAHLWLSPERSASAPAQLV